MSISQLLDNSDQLQKEPTDSFLGYAVKLAKKVAVLTTEVIAKFEKAKGSTMTREDVFKLIGGVLMIREVRKVPDAYTSVMTQVKDDFDATSIGQLAATFLTLKEKNDLVLGQTATVNYTGNPGDRRAEKPCFRDGHCTRKKCPYKHTKQSRPKAKPSQGQTSRGGGGRQEQGTRNEENTRRNRRNNQGQKRQENVNVVEDLEYEDEGGDHADIFSVDSARVFRQ